MKHSRLSALAATISGLGLGMALAPNAIAHPGHGIDASANGLLHFLLQPSHGGTALLVLVALAALGITYERRRLG